MGMTAPRSTTTDGLGSPAWMRAPRKPSPVLSGCSRWLARVDKRVLSHRTRSSTSERRGLKTRASRAIGLEVWADSAAVAGCWRDAKLRHAASGSTPLPNTLRQFGDFIGLGDSEGILSDLKK